MRIGIDFDNTIVRYDSVFHRVALELRLIPKDLPRSKDKVRNYLRGVGREDVWTDLQGLVYGTRMAEAEPFPGALDFFSFCRVSGIPVCIISHKSRHPYSGPPYDLHGAAWQWLELYGFFDPSRLDLPRKQIYFELTKAEKLNRIEQAGCTHFIDDLPELLAEPGFPSTVERILFDPGDVHGSEKSALRVCSWRGIIELIWQFGRK
jgi:hypothetical protein